MTGIIKKLIFSKINYHFIFLFQQKFVPLKRYPEYNLFTLKKTNTY